MRILISAYACTPGDGSEPGAGWGLVRAAAAAHDVTLLTQAKNARPVIAALAAEQLGPVVLLSVEGPDRLRRFRGRIGLGHIHYLAWQYRAWKVARRLQREVDVVHHATYANDWLPCALHCLSGVPVVWGPVGGTAPIAWQLVRYLSPRGFALELAREALSRLARQLTIVFVRRSGALVVAANREVASRFAKHASAVVVEPHVALPPAPTASSRRDAIGDVHQAIFAARLVSWKGPYLALEALTRAPTTWCLDFYGDGPERQGIRRRVDQLGLGDRVRLLGQRPREDLWAALAAADVLLFPSLHDTSGHVVAEAVRVGCPVVCLDVGGPPVLIEGTGGVAVRADRHAPDRLAQAMVSVRRQAPSDRWSVDRLVATTSEWYATAVQDA